MSRPQPTEEELKRGVDFGWKTHAAITDWTSKVDTKASIVLSLGGVLLGIFINLSTGGRLLDELEGWRLVFSRIGLGAMGLGVLAAALVVAPRLKRRQSQRIWRQNFLYFGHLRHWDPANLRRKLERLDGAAELDVLSKQLVTTSKIAWQKHSRLQLSVAAILTGVSVITLAVAWPS